MVGQLMTDQIILTRATAWFRRKTDPTATITRIDGSGSDWAGSTEDGFHSTFDVTITFVRANGTYGSAYIQGAELAELWTAIVHPPTEGIS
jgi:hypothetical protein